MELVLGLPRLLEAAKKKARAVKRWKGNCSRDHDGRLHSLTLSPGIAHSSITVMIAPIPRLLLLDLRPKLPARVPPVSALYLQSLPHGTLPRYRNASTASSKPIVLEKPERFNPPSHPQRLNKGPPRNYPGPPISESQRKVQKNKQYPNSFPPEGTWSHWFLTHISIHVFIVLVSMA